MTTIESPRAVFKSPTHLVVRDEKEEQFIQGCIDSLTTFDDTKREQTYYKQIIKDSFSFVLAKNSRISQKLFLDAQHPEIAMHMKLLDINDPSLCQSNKIKLDKKTMYIVLKGEVKIKKEMTTNDWLDEVDQIAGQGLAEGMSPLAHRQKNLSEVISSPKKQMPIRRMTLVMRMLQMAPSSPSKKSRAAKPNLLQIARENQNEKIKNLLMSTSFIGEYTQHSNPTLQAKICEDDLMKKKNLTIDLVNTFHKDFVIKQYEAAIQEEKAKYERSERFGLTLVPGSVVNDAAMIIPKSYLDDYVLTFDPSEEPPIIAKITHYQFKESLIKTDEDCVEKLINFSKCIPGFQYMNKSTARRLFFLFTQQKVKKGWQMQSNDYEIGHNCPQPPPPPSELLSPKSNSDALNDEPSSSTHHHPEKLIYIISRGNFVFQSFNQKLTPFSSLSQNRVLTTLTNCRRRGGNQGPGHKGTSGNGLMRKFLSVERPQKISIEDRKNIRKNDEIKMYNKYRVHEKVKRLILGKGQIFGEDECLNMIYNLGNPKPEPANYTVTCESNDGEVLFADIEDVYKLFKNEKRILKFMNEQYSEKYPDQQLTDNFFEQAFQNRPQANEKKLISKNVMPVQRNLQEFGICNNVEKMLLNQTELDFRETIKEIVKDYPSTRSQKFENIKSEKNHERKISPLKNTVDVSISEYDLNRRRDSRILSNPDLDIYLNGKPIQKFQNRIYMNSKIDAVIQRNQLYKLNASASRTPDLSFKTMQNSNRKIDHSVFGEQPTFKKIQIASTFSKKSRILNTSIDQSTFIQSQFETSNIFNGYNSVMMRNTQNNFQPRTQIQTQQGTQIARQESSLMQEPPTERMLQSSHVDRPPVIVQTIENPTSINLPELNRPNPKKLLAQISNRSNHSGGRKKVTTFADFRAKFQQKVQTKAADGRKQVLLSNGARELKRLQAEREQFDVNKVQVQNTYQSQSQSDDVEMEEEQY